MLEFVFLGKNEAKDVWTLPSMGFPRFIVWTIPVTWNVLWGENYNCTITIFLWQPMSKPTTIAVALKAWVCICLYLFLTFIFHFLNFLFITFILFLTINFFHRKKKIKSLLPKQKKLSYIIKFLQLKKWMQLLALWETASLSTLHQFTHFYIFFTSIILFT